MRITKIKYMDSKFDYLVRVENSEVIFIEIKLPFWTTLKHLITRKVVRLNNFTDDIDNKSIIVNQKT